MCRAVRYEISAAPIAAGLCHCDRCRPQSGSAFSTVIVIRRSTSDDRQLGSKEKPPSSTISVPAVSILRADVARAVGHHSR
jgi:hypothetical protein